MAGEEMPAESQGRRLDSWKEIAAHLQRDVRTVQRWEAREGMPVHRQPHQEQGSVYAFAAELDAWRHPPGSVLHAPASRLRWPSLAALAPVALLLVLGVALRLRRPAKAAVRPASAPLSFATRYFAQATAEGARASSLQLTGVARALVFSPDASSLYAVYDHGVDLFDVRTGRVLRHYVLGAELGPAVLVPDGDLYVADSLRPQVYKLSSHAASATSRPLPGAATALALTPDGGTLYATVAYAGLERVITSSGAHAWFPLPPCPSNLAIPPAGTDLFVSFQCGGPGGRPGHDAIGVFDTARGVLRDAFSGPPGDGIGANRDGSQLWASSGDACVNPQYDHVGCPQVPAFVLYAFDAKSRALVRARSVPSTGSEITLLPGTSDPLPSRNTPDAEL